MEMTGGQALARQLVAEGVRDMFGIPGVQLDWATDGLLDVADKLRYYTPRHEQAASYMADGYARTSGREGVCMVVPGPGLLNAMSGLATAYACNSPVLCISGQIPSHHIGRDLGMLHEVRDQSATLGTVTKWNALATKPQDIPGLVNEAFRQMRTGQPRPVGIEVPPDVLQARADIELLAPAVGDTSLDIEPALLEQLAQDLKQARFPVIYVGGGALAAQAGEALQRLAERLSAPVVMSENGRGTISSRHPLATTLLGSRCLFPHADFVLVVGSRFVDGMGRPTHASAACRYAYVNLNAAHLGAPRQPGTALSGDARAVLAALAELVEGHRPAESREGAVAQVKAWCEQQFDQIQPQRAYAQVLRRLIPENGILVSELTQVGYMSNISYPIYERRTLITPGYQGTLGYGFATAIGASLGNPHRPVVSINGDGGFGWNLQELATVAKYRPRLVTIVFADGAFGNVRRIQANVFKREIGTDLCNPDFVALARAFGLPAVSVDSPEGLESELAAALRSDGPAFIEVKVSAMPGAWHLIHSFSKAPHAAPPNPLGEPLVAA